MGYFHITDPQPDYISPSDFREDLVVYLDMDGVIADFASRVSVLFGGFKFDPKEYDLPKQLGITKEKFWDTIRSVPCFWRTVPHYDHTQEIFKICSRFGPTYFLTDPHDDCNAYIGKLIWLMEAFDFSQHEAMVRLLLTSQKHLFAHGRAYLIDDKEDNVDLFMKFGGNAFIFPTPHNRKGQTAKLQPKINLENWLRMMTKVKPTKQDG